MTLKMEKTLFNDEAEYSNAFTDFRTLSGNYTKCPSTRGTKPISDSVLANSISIKTARKCNGVDANKLCNSSSSYTMTSSHYVIFCYKWYGGQWIMRTAYPKYKTGPLFGNNLADECTEEFLTADGENEAAHVKSIVNKFKN